MTRRPYARADFASAHDSGEDTSFSEPGPTITAIFSDGPLEGSTRDADVVEGRPPKVIDVPADDGRACRYCLAGWVQAGSSAAYTFLYRV